MYLKERAGLLLVLIILIIMSYVFYLFKGNIHHGNIGENLFKRLMGEANHNRVAQDNPRLIKRLIDHLNHERVAQDDPRLIKLIRDHYLHKPSEQKYNLTDSHRYDFSQYGQSSIVDGLLHKMMRGFFVECGAFDGETDSNSLSFERDRQWDGLLIEPDPIHFTTLTTKNRKSFTINTCLSLTPHPSLMTLNRNLPKWGRLVHNDDVKHWMAGLGFHKDEIQVQCFPLYSILLALNQTQVDFLSLDIEGDELLVLKAIPFEKIDFRILLVECKQPPLLREIILYLDSKGYQNTTRAKNDVIFIKKRRKNT